MTVNFAWLFSSWFALSMGPGAEAEGTISVGTSGADASAEGEADGPAEGEASDNGDTGNKGKRRSKSKRKDQPWIRRWAPERNTWELGIFGGVMFPHPRHELFEYDFTLVDQGFRPINRVAPDIGLRVAYLPLRILGLEAEGAVLPTEVDNGQSALLYAARGHLLLQLPRWSVTPFVLAGVTGLGVSSGREAIGNDIDLGFHFGGGVKIYMSRRSALRLDVRDTMTARRGVGESVVHSPEVLLGLSLVLGRKDPEPPPGPVDTDGDGIFDPDDQCPNEPGVPEYDGCPIPDTDGDGILDPDDQCVDEPGVPEYDGCPIPDTDGDGILDPDDKCVDEPGVPEYDGCPIPDTDGDGILDPDDKCVEEPETSNGFQDEDGCPDEVPKEIKKFTGVIKGIYFDTGKATIRKKSMPVLKNALKVLQEFPELRLEVSGHTDDRGSDDANLELSQRRADAVRDYFVDAGLDAKRFQTRGAGETEPIESNKTKKGRAKNRRIEFKLLQK
ncbi:MAG: OmpA family protein [Myxococcota bacterium]